MRFRPYTIKTELFCTPFHLSVQMKSPRFHCSSTLIYASFIYKDIAFRHEDLKQMLDSNKDGLKLEAMKRVVGVSDLQNICTVDLRNVQEHVWK